MLVDGSAGLLCTVPSEEQWLGDADGVGGSKGGTWISAEKGQCQGTTAQHPTGGRMLCSSPPQETPQREEETHISSVKWL